MYRDGLSELLSTLQISIGLALADRPVASQAFGSLGKWRMLAEEGASLIEPLGFLSIAGARHETYKYVYLCHKSRGFSYPFTLPPKTNRPVKLKVIFCVQAVISPLLANLYLHWFDKVFHGPQGPARWAKAKLGRYADDFVVLARYVSPQLRGYIEEKLETWMGLEINREKTQVVNLKEKKARLDFLGYTFRYDRSQPGGGRYLNVVPSKKAVQRERDRLRAMTDYTQSHKPLPQLIAKLNRHLKGWGNYFCFGYPRAAYGWINTYVLQRLYYHGQRRSQRPFRPPQGVSFNQQFFRMGLRLLTRPRT